MATDNKYFLTIPERFSCPRSRWSSPASSVSPREVSLITSTFSSLRSSCWVCPGLVTLVTRDAMDSASLVSREPLVPVLLLNMGGSRAREKRSVDLVLADRRTGLAILRDRLDTLSNYRWVDTMDNIQGTLSYILFAGAREGRRCTGGITAGTTQWCWA